MTNMLLRVLRLERGGGFHSLDSARFLCLRRAPATPLTLAPAKVVLRAAPACSFSPFLLFASSSPGVVPLRLAVALLCWFCGMAASPGQSETNLVRTPRRDLTELSLDELANLEITSVSKQPQKLSEAPAAIAVVTQEDIRRSGVTTIADALRLVPGLEVGQVDAHTRAISSRGFSDVFANKLLVLMDGRSVYTPLFSGVYWDAQDTLLEDLDRIEIIRGPGGTLWGANAVNGVINIMTKSAKETQGLLLSTGGGTEELGFGSLRYGGKLAENAYYRVYSKYFSRADSVMPSGANGQDAWSMGRTGFRVDWEPGAQDWLTFQGDLYTGTEDQIYTLPSPNPPYTQTVPTDLETSGGNVMGRWTRTFSDTASLQFQAYYDRTVRNGITLRETRDTGDVEFQHRFGIGQRQQIIWGAGYRASGDSFDSSYTVEVQPHHRLISLGNGFMQDEITLVPDNLRLTLGAKLEQNSFTGLEFQPSGRLLWTPHERHSVWGSVARAVRTPSRVEDNGRINLQVLPAGAVGPLPAVVSAFGQQNFRSEELIAYEAGYRFQPKKWLSVDAAAFYNVYDRLRSIEAVSPGEIETSPPSPHILVPLVAGNELFGETYGVELAVTAQATDWWRLYGSYTYLQMQLHTRHGSTDTTSEAAEGQSPHHQFSIRSSMDLPGHFEVDCGLRYVDPLPALDVPSYFTLDARLAWRPNRRWEISVVGQNLWDNRHPESAPSAFIGTQSTEVERAIYGKIAFNF